MPTTQEKLKEKFYNKESISCRDNMELTFFNYGGLRGRNEFEHVCAICGSSPDESPLVSKSTFTPAITGGKTPLPLCERCWDDGNGKKPVLVNRSDKVTEEIGRKEAKADAKAKAKAKAPAPAASKGKGKAPASAASNPKAKAKAAAPAASNPWEAPAALVAFLMSQMAHHPLRSKLVTTKAMVAMTFAKSPEPPLLMTLSLHGRWWTQGRSCWHMRLAKL